MLFQGSYRQFPEELPFLSELSDFWGSVPCAGNWFERVSCCNCVELHVFSLQLGWRSTVLIVVARTAATNCVYFVDLLLLFYPDTPLDFSDDFTTLISRGRYNHIGVHVVCRGLCASVFINKFLFVFTCSKRVLQCSKHVSSFENYVGILHDNRTSLRLYYICELWKFKTVFVSKRKINTGAQSCSFTRMKHTKMWSEGCSKTSAGLWYVLKIVFWFFRTAAQ